MRLKSVYQLFLKQYGSQYWWPADTRFEIMVGAILTQNTAWENVERALDNLKKANALDPVSILKTPKPKLARWLKPSGYFNIKADRLKQFCRWYVEQNLYDGLKHRHSLKLRKMLLSVNGVGPETADDILLYAFNRKIFVIDAYTRRIFSRLGLIKKDSDYEVLRMFFETALQAESVKLFNEYHALIVMHAKQVCKTRPICERCCLKKQCPGKGV